jgi:hypothetical protein
MYMTRQHSGFMLASQALFAHYDFTLLEDLALLELSTRRCGAQLPT